MKVIAPTAITSQSLIASNVPVDDAGDWVSGSYSTGQQVVRNGHLWESLTDNNTATPGEEQAAPLKWLDLGPVNRMAMFDKRAGTKWLIGTSTTNPESIDLTIRPGAVVNAIGLVGVKAKEIQITVTDPTDGVVYDRTVSMARVTATSWYEYWFNPIERRENVVLMDLPAYGTADVQVVVRSPGGIAEVAMMVLGRQHDIGDTVFGTGFGYQSYSDAQEDVFGNTSLVPRGSRRIVDYDVLIPTPNVSQIMRLLNSLKDEAALYVGAPWIDATIIAGRFDQLRTIISNVAFCDMTLEVRSLE